MVMFESYWPLNEKDKEREEQKVLALIFNLKTAF
jgi:hypothetical protein